MELVEGKRYDGSAVVARARALLAQPEPEGVSADEWDALVERAWDKYKTVGYQGELFMYDSDFGNALDFVRKELAPWDHPTPQPPADGEVAGDVVEVPKKVALTTRYQAHLREDRLFHICDEAQPLIVQWWNESRKSRHGVKATWTEAAWKASVYRVANLPECQQVLLCKAGVEHGWQSLKPEYLKDELAKPTGDGRPMPKDPSPHTP